MKMLILGGHGMAGHVLVRHFREQGVTRCSIPRVIPGTQAP